MTVPFLEIVNISITAGWIVLAVLVLRLLFRKAPKWLNCVLWGIVALRLVFPFSIESVFSLIPSAETFEPNLPYLNEFKINSGIEVLDNAVNTQYADFAPIAERTVDVTII
ncbi:MAG: transcriptional regulator, partial [Clostridia bacterium]|nr:transcriptional regulator [Clostridia bacterium]